MNNASSWELACAAAELLLSQDLPLHDVLLHSSEGAIRVAKSPVSAFVRFMAGRMLT